MMKKELFYPPSQKTSNVSLWMNAKNFLLRRDSAPDEARGEDTPRVSSRELHRFPIIRRLAEGMTMTLLILFLASAPTVLAQTTTLTPTNKPAQIYSSSSSLQLSSEIMNSKTFVSDTNLSYLNIRKELKNELKEKREELKDGLKEKLQENKVERKNIIEEVKAKIADSVIKNGVVQGEVATLSGTILPATILVTTNKSEKNPKSITLNITVDTVLLRKFGASSSMSEIHVGDKIIARGTWTDNTKIVLKVSSLRNNSVQKKNATFWGKISSIATESSSIVVSTQKGDQTIKPDSSTKYTNRSGGPISFTDLKIGHWIRVSGVWDTVLKLVEEVKNIKDWTLPSVKK